MSQLYASILGSAAFVTILARMLVDEGAVLGTWGIALAGLGGFAAIGFVTGRFASQLVRQPTRTPDHADVARRMAETQVDT